MGNVKCGRIHIEALNKELALATDKWLQLIGNLKLLYIRT